MPLSPESKARVDYCLVFPKKNTCNKSTRHWTARGARAADFPSPPPSLCLTEDNENGRQTNERQPFRALPQRPLCALVCSRHLATKPTPPANPPPPLLPYSNARRESLFLHRVIPSGLGSGPIFLLFRQRKTPPGATPTPRCKAKCGASPSLTWLGSEVGQPPLQGPTCPPPHAESGLWKALPSLVQGQGWGVPWSGDSNHSP